MKIEKRRVSVPIPIEEVNLIVESK